MGKWEAGITIWAKGKLSGNLNWKFSCFQALPLKLYFFSLILLIYIPIPFLWFCTCNFDNRRFLYFGGCKFDDIKGQSNAFSWSY